MDFGMWLLGFINGAPGLTWGYDWPQLCFFRYTQGVMLVGLSVAFWLLINMCDDD